MRAEPFGCGQLHGGGRQRAELLGAKLEDGRALDKIQHRKPGGEPRRAGGGQDMVGAADIIADHFRRMGAEEDRPGIADFRQQRLGVGDRQFDMLGGEAVGEGDGIRQSN